jgi:3-hydroxy-9,10-secoandrosta-1,3,5(10)-triene-9,17-dione monooxygenase reductase component
MKIKSSPRPLPAQPIAPKAPSPPSTPVDGYAGPVPDQPPVIDQAGFRKALGNFPTGVTVITTGTGEDKRGMTASSFNSVSLDPPLVLFSASNNSGTLAELKKNGGFVVNLLASNQTDVCYRFARGSHQERFANLETDTSSVTGSPLLRGTLGHFDCRVETIVPAGDHHIIIGRVVDLHNAQQGLPLTTWTSKMQNVDDWARNQ